MNLRLVLITLGMVIFNLTLILIAVDMAVGAQYVFASTKQRLDYETGMANPYGERLRRLLRLSIAAIVLSLLLGIYFWRVH